MNRLFCALLLGSLLVGSALASPSDLNMFRKVSDFDGDGRADFAVIRDEAGKKIWYVWQSTAGFKVMHWGTGFDLSAAGDYNADGVTDFAVFRDTSTFPPLWTFHILESGSNVYTRKSFTAIANFGGGFVHQDYNGDGRVDAALTLGEFGFSRQLQIQFSGPAGGGSSE
ncbi:MAG: VCBS repeat-containing protein, partial [Pyrinomonadaceae bacterium]